MLVYDTKKFRGLVVLFQLLRCDFKGSVFPNVLPYCVIASLITGFIKTDEALEWGVFRSIHNDLLFDHSYSLHIWAMAVGFLLVFRNNLAHMRYWEGRQQICKFTQYLQEAVLMATSYDAINKDMNQYKEWKEDFLHQASLLHAIAMQALRLDHDLTNLIRFDPYDGYVHSDVAVARDGAGGGSAAGPYPGQAGSDDEGSPRGVVQAPANNKEKKRNNSLTGERRRKYSVTAATLMEQMAAADAVASDSTAGGTDGGRLSPADVVAEMEEASLSVPSPHGSVASSLRSPHGSVTSLHEVVLSEADEEEEEEGEEEEEDPAGRVREWTLPTIHEPNPWARQRGSTASVLTTNCLSCGLSLSGTEKQ